MWQIITALGFIFLILEMFTPSLFFLNFAIAAFICAIISLFYANITALVVIFSLLSVLLIFTLRPLLVKKCTCKSQQTGIESKYIGKVVPVIEDIDKNNGAISIYDERWQARNCDEGVILKGEKVKIINLEGIIMQVQKVD